MASTPGSGSDSQSPVAAANGVAETIETNHLVTDSSDDDDIQTRPPRKHGAPDEDEVPELEKDEDGDNAGDLFGSASEDEGKRSPKRRKLSDEELDSGDDEKRRDRVDEDVDMDSPRAPSPSEMVARIDLARHGMPRGSDGELYLLRHPQFMSIEPKAFTPQSFKAPTTGHHGSTPTSNFSAAQVANSTIRWRRDPNNPSNIQSNARIVRWSDGSLTLQLGTTPTDQHELPAKPLAPAQVNPIKPVPTTRPKRSTGYDNRMESYTYIASVHPVHDIVQVYDHLTTSLTIQSVNEEDDEALVRLQEALNAATKVNKGADGQGPGVISIKEDPDLAKRKAEIAEREKMRAERRRQNQAERERDRTTRVVGRARGTGGAGLTAAGLEDEDGMLPSRGKQKAGARRPRRRNSEYSEDEDEGYGRRGNKEDEYDEDDGFLVRSDEEPEIVEDDSAEEEEFGEEDAEGEEEDDTQTVAKAAKIEEAKPAAAEDEGEGEDPAAGARVRRRRVIDEDEDE